MSELENHMLIDSYWGEIEYGVPYPDREEREEEYDDGYEEELGFV